MADDLEVEVSPPKIGVSVGRTDDELKTPDEENPWADLITGKEDVARGLLVHGEQGTGKSHFAAHAPKPFAIRTEDGMKEFAIHKTPLCESLDDVRLWLGRFLKNPGDFTHLVIDTVDWLVHLLEEAICKEKGVEALSDIPYGKGDGILVARVLKFLTLLDKVKAKGVDIILLAHTQTEKVNPPNSDEYQKFTPKMPRKVNALFQEWADEIFFLHYETDLVTKDAGFGQTVNKAVDQTRRIITQDSPYCAAKCRLPGVPQTIDAEFSTYWKYRQNWMTV